MMNKKNKPEKRYVVNTYNSWAAKYQTRIMTVKEIEMLQQMNLGIEIEEIFELGKQVKLETKMVPQ